MCHTGVSWVKHISYFAFGGGKYSYLGAVGTVGAVGAVGGCRMRLQSVRAAGRESGGA